MSGLILASSSPTRRRVLQAAGLEFSVAAPGVDEEEVKRSLRAQGATGMQIAETLAELKAQRISARHDGALVIGADQVLECNKVLFDKPADLAHARGQLQALRGKSHDLLCAICVAQNGARIWHHNGRVTLRMRPFSDAFLDEYLRRAGEDLLGSVGAYRLEGLGAQLFSRIDGDWFSILGVPLLPLLDFLRGHKLVAS
jgi:septum formation protein